jgi:hypothetical protein
MNCCHESTKMGGPRAAQALAPRAGQPQGVCPEAYMNGTSEGPTPEDGRLPARSAYSSERRMPKFVVAVSNSCNIRARSLEASIDLFAAR